MLKVRIEGLPDEVNAFLEDFRKDHEVLQESKPYPNRNSQYVRVYVDCTGKKKSPSRSKK